MHRNLTFSEYQISLRDLIHCIYIFLFHYPDFTSIPENLESGPTAQLFQGAGSSALQIQVLHLSYCRNISKSFSVHLVHSVVKYRAGSVPRQIYAFFEVREVQFHKRRSRENRSRIDSRIQNSLSRYYYYYFSPRSIKGCGTKNKTEAITWQ